jgi:hypothetical protein
MQKELERNPTRKITLELRKMHEIFGDQNVDCGMAAQYEDGTCSRIAYDPAKMSFRKRMEIQPLTVEERQASRVADFVNIINPQHKKYGVIVPKEVNK